MRPAVSLVMMIASAVFGCAQQQQPTPPKPVISAYPPGERMQYPLRPKSRQQQIEIPLDEPTLSPAIESKLGRIEWETRKLRDGLGD
jgi:hypothetical protein